MDIEEDSILDIYKKHKSDLLAQIDDIKKPLDNLLQNLDGILGEESHIDSSLIRLEENFEMNDIDETY